MNIAPNELGKAAVLLFIILFGGKTEDSLNHLGYVKFLEIASSNNAVDSQKLLLTERAAHFHCLRVHLQVIPRKKLVHEEPPFNPKN